MVAPTKISGGGQTIVIDDVRDCVDKFNNKGQITNILGKTLEPILYLHDIKERLPYASSCSYYTTQHIGQLKLLISEIHFCTIATKAKDDSFVMVYAGSAPNHKGFILNELFPNMKALLVDPAEHLLYKPNGGDQYDKSLLSDDKVLYFCCADGNKFNVKNRIINIYDGKTVIRANRDSAEVKLISDNWKNKTTIEDEYLEAFNLPYNNYIIEDYFKDETAEFCKKLKASKDIIFVSDIRTNLNDNLKKNIYDKKDVTDLDICVNSAMMLSWVNIMQPRLSMLKFRPPYFLGKERIVFEKNCNQGMYKYYFDKVKSQVDFVKDYKDKKFRYIIGDEALQAFAGTTSGETRLIFSDIKIGLIDHIKREEQLFYYNQIRRQYGFHDNQTDSITGIDNCGDCALSQKVISNYIDKYNFGEVKDNITLQSMITLLRRSINIDNHGGFLSMNHIIEDVYRQQGGILTKSYYIKNIRNKISLKSIDWSIEKMYQMRKMMGKFAELSQKYIVNKQYGIKGFEYILIRYLYDIGIWSDPNVIYKYYYYNLITNRALTKQNANNLLDEINVLLTNLDDNNSSSVIVKSDSDKINMVYKDFSIDISKDWEYTLLLRNDNPENILKSILYDERINANGFITIPDKILDIIKFVKYDNLCEISLGIHDRLFRETPSESMKLTNYTHVACGLNNLEELKPSYIPSKTIIIGNYHNSPLLVNYLRDDVPDDTLLIFISMDPPNLKSSYSGYRIRFPYKSVNFMKKPVDFYAEFISFHFQGAPELLYNIKKYYESL
jgi:uncharacterized protein YegP (UPF0339 family)